MANNDPVAIEIPTAERDKPAWVKVGVIAAVGFIIGIAWPRLAGVRLGPSAPGESAAIAAASAARAGRAPDSPPPASVVTKTPAVPSGSAAPAPTTPPAAAASLPPNIAVQKGTVMSCKSESGEKKKGGDCGSVPGVDQIVIPRVKKIATCSGVEGQTGKVSLTVNADFTSGRFWYDVNKTSTVQNLDAITACLKTVFHNTATTATPHEHARYTVGYTAVLTAPTASGDDDKAIARKDKTGTGTAADAKDRSAKEAPDEKSADAPQPKASANGEAEVVWEVALVRDAPKTGALVSRLPRGTKVKIGTPKDGWFQIKFGENLASEGWVYRGAIGR